MGKLSMLSQSAVFMVSAIVSLCVWVPMTLNLVAFTGHCLLYSDGQYNEEDGRFDPNWASPAYCGFTLFVGVSVFIITFFLAIRKAILLCRGIDSTFLSVFIDAMISLIYVLLVLLDAFFVTKGFSVFCNSIAQRFDSCETAAAFVDIGKHSGIDATQFFVELGTIQFGIWTLLVCWVLSLVISSRRLFVYHEMENMTVSMARERQRHIQNDYSSLNT